MKHFFDENQERLLISFLNSFQVSLAEKILEQLFDYTNLVLEGNEKTNLISKNDGPKFLTRHITDSLIPYIILSKKNKLSPGMKWADMGSGAGCPVFPLAITCPDIHFYAVEPRAKRVLFLESVKENLNLKNITIVGKRFETSEINHCDIISCRALSTFENDWQRAKPALRQHGLFVTLKSFESVRELQETPHTEIVKYSLPEETQNYALVIRGYYE